METKEVIVYQTFLEKVREENSDEYAELKDILSRYTVLLSSRDELEKRQGELTAQLDHTKKHVAQ